MAESAILNSIVVTPSSNNESAGIKRMPVEVLENSLRFLPTRSLKKARLTCKYWGAVGARCLFHRIYFTPRKEVIDLFLKIVGDEAFASNIEELVYDSRLFTDRIYEVERYPRSISSYFPGEFSNEDEIEDEAENEWSEWKRYDDSAANSDNGASASHLPPHGSGALVAAGSAQRRSQSTSLAVENLVDRAAEYRRLLREQKAIFNLLTDIHSMEKTACCNSNLKCRRYLLSPCRFN